MTARKICHSDGFLFDFFPRKNSGRFHIQRFSEVTDQSGMAILSVIPGNPLLWAFLMEIFNLGIVKTSVTPENPLFPNPVLPKTSVFSLTLHSVDPLIRAHARIKETFKLIGVVLFFESNLRNSFLTGTKKKFTAL